MGDSVSAMFAVAAFGMLCFLWSHITTLRKRLARVEGKLDVLLKNADLQYDPFSDIPNDVADAIRSGNKMLAIKLYREATGINLADAKEFVEDLQCQSGVGDAASANLVALTFMLMLTMGVCSAVCTLATLLILRPNPGSFLGFIPAVIAGMVGAFAGMGIFFAIYKSRQKRKSNAANK
ncbi:MAG: hypothetical protein H8E44_09970 [Planctomycetes bacterium]|nr:hypothetical protein [Planctomycetota bacterium]MBL7041975.1 hypothetical protein [Pirellulaceae bacterium]